ncbi:MAG TPA: hypothetical protein VM120_03985 [Bryobacteraceae bacterium]|nr:hypothetical protein [Bryobacteraceae bacterium]
MKKRVAITTSAPAAEQPKQELSENADSVSNRTPRSEPPPLNHMQELLCDLAGDLILNGGHREDVDNFITSMTCHYWRRLHPKYPTELDKREKDLNEHVETRREEWTRSLTRGWLPKAEPSDETPAPKSLIEKLRTRYRSTLRDQFEDFLRYATPEEVRILSEVFSSHESNSTGPQFYDPEASLANAFMSEIGATSSYVRVPDEHLKLVLLYMKVLRIESPEQSETAA